MGEKQGQLLTQSGQFPPVALLLFCPGALRHTGAVQKTEEEGIDMPNVGVRDHLIDQTEKSQELTNPHPPGCAWNPVRAEESSKKDFAKNLDLLDHLSGGQPTESTHAPVEGGNLMEKRFHLIAPGTNGRPQHLHDGAKEGFPQVIQSFFAATGAGTEFGSPTEHDVGRLRFEPLSQLGAVV